MAYILIYKRRKRAIRKNEPKRFRYIRGHLFYDKWVDDTGIVYESACKHKKIFIDGPFRPSHTIKDISCKAFDLEDGELRCKQCTLFIKQIISIGIDEADGIRETEDAVLVMDKFESDTFSFLNNSFQERLMANSNVDNNSKYNEDQNNIGIDSDLHHKYSMRSEDEESICAACLSLSKVGSSGFCQHCSDRYFSTAKYFNWLYD